MLAVMGAPVVAERDFAGWVELLADPLRAKQAYWHLLLSGPEAGLAARAGLAHADSGVRQYCAQLLDHLAASQDDFRLLIRMLADTDPQVRLHALHALACDRCKKSGCRPDKGEVLRPAIAILQYDPHKQVRAMAVEVVGRWAHTDRAAATALIECRDRDPDPSVRKKAKWYAPGGTIYRKRAPRGRAA